MGQSTATNRSAITLEPEQAQGAKARAQSRNGVLLFLGGLIAVAFAIRIIAIAVVFGLNSAPRSGSDAVEYDQVAWNLVTGHGFRGPSPDVDDHNHLTAYRPPVAPLYYAAIYAIAGHRYIAAHVVNSIMGAWCVWLIYAITLQVFNRRAAILAATVYTFFPMAIFFNLTLLSETISAWLILLLVWLALRIRDRFVFSLGLGFVFGLVLLTKPGYVFLLPLLPIWAWRIAGSNRTVWLRAAMLPICAGLVILPWGIRNYVELGKFIPFGTGGGSLLLQTNNRVVVEAPILYGYSVWDTSIPEYADSLRNVNDEIKRDALAKKYAIEWLRANPDKWFYLAQGKIRRLWTPMYYGPEPFGVRLFVSGYYAIILVFFCTSVLPVTIRWWRERSPALMMQFLILATTMMAVVFHGQHRYRIPIDSLCICIASAGAISLLQHLRDGRVRQDLAACLSMTRRTRWRLIPGSIALAVFIGYWFADQSRIEAYRRTESERRLDNIQLATQRYFRKYNQLPSDIGTLVPEFLPNLDALHAPNHSVPWPMYQLLPSHDVTNGKPLISYELVHPVNVRSEVVIQENFHAAEKAKGIRRFHVP